MKTDNSTMDNVDMNDITGDKMGGSDTDSINEMQHIKEFVDGLDPDELAYLKTCVESMTDAKQPEDDLVGAFAKAKSGEQPDTSTNGGKPTGETMDDGEDY